MEFFIYLCAFKNEDYVWRMTKQLVKGLRNSSKAIKDRVSFLPNIK